MKLLPPLYVRPYVQRSKTDRADVKGMLEAWRNSEIRPVPVKTESQQQLTSLHRMRSGWMAARTMRINSARGLLREFGFVFPLGAAALAGRVRELIEDADTTVSDAAARTAPSDGFGNRRVGNARQSRGEAIGSDGGANSRRRNYCAPFPASAC